MRNESLTKAALLLAAVAAFVGVAALAVAKNAAQQQQSRIDGIYGKLAAIAADLKLLPRNDISHEHSEVRVAMIRFALSQAKRPIVILGDSNTEATRYPDDVCNLPLINGGIGGATIDDFVQSTGRFLSDSTPSAIIISLGTNNAIKGATQESFTTQYQTLWKMAKRFSPIVIAATIPDIHPGRPLSDQYFDASKIAPFNEEIRKIAGTAVINLNEPLSHADLTVDGIHFTGGGYDILSRTMVSGIANTICPISTTATSVR